MWLIPKDAGFEKIERLRPLWFESDILKMKEFVIEARVDKLLRSKEMLEPEQSGFEKNRDCGAAIFPVAQLIEDSRVRNRQLWVAFLDQMKAFDTLESFQGKLMASMVLGLPFKYANQLDMKLKEAALLGFYSTKKQGTETQRLAWEASSNACNALAAINWGEERYGQHLISKMRQLFLWISSTLTLTLILSLVTFG